MQEKNNNRNKEFVAALLGIILGLIVALARTPAIWSILVRIAAHWPM